MKLAGHWRLTLAGFLPLTAVLLTADAGQQGRSGWRDSFSVDKANLTSTGSARYFVLEPGFRLHLAKGKDTLIVTVLDETRDVDGVTTRVVEERETQGGKLVEVSRNFFAIDKNTSDVYYFGEEVEMYKNGKLVSHEGAWLSGENGARFGLMVPGEPKIGDKYYQEIAPKVAMDRAEVLSLSEEVRVPAGTFQDCLHTRESTPLERAVEGKWYAPGVGLIRDADMVLVKVERPKS